MIKVKINAGGTESEAIVWSARHNTDGSAYLFTGLDESSHIKIVRGDIVTVMPFFEDDENDEAVKIKIYGNGDLHNICETIKTGMVWKLMGADTSHLVSFSQISEICQPAFGIHAMNLDSRNEYIYSTGNDSLSDKIYHNSAVTTGLIRNVQIGRKKVLMVGGFGTMPVKLMNERALHEFAAVVNNYFPD